MSANELLCGLGQAVYAWLSKALPQSQAFKVVRDQHVNYTEKPAREGQPLRAALALALVVCLLMQCTQKGRVRCACKAQEVAQLVKYLP